MGTVDLSLRPPSSFFNASGPDTEFTVASYNARALSSQVRHMWAGNISLQESFSTFYTSTNDLVNMIYGRGISDIPSMISNLAKSMTKNMRNAQHKPPSKWNSVPRRSTSSSAMANGSRCLARSSSSH
jgi:hypothetical protein